MLSHRPELKIVRSVNITLLLYVNKPLRQADTNIEVCTYDCRNRFYNAVGNKKPECTGWECAVRYKRGLRNDNAYGEVGGSNVINAILVCFIQAPLGPDCQLRHKKKCLFCGQVLIV